MKKIFLILAAVVLLGLGIVKASSIGNIDRLDNEKGQIYLNGHNLNLTAAATIEGTHSGTSSGVNTGGNSGDETTTTIKSKLGVVSSVADGYETAAIYNASVNTGKTNSTGFWLCTSANCSSTAQLNVTNGLIQ